MFEKSNKTKPKIKMKIKLESDCIFGQLSPVRALSSYKCWHLQVYKLVNRLDTSDICVLTSDIQPGTGAVAETSHHRNLNCIDAGCTFFPLLWGWSDGFYLWTAVTNFPVWMSMEAKTHVFLFQRLRYNSHQLWPYQNAHSQITGVLFLMVHSTIFSAL